MFFLSSCGSLRSSRAALCRHLPSATTWQIEELVRNDIVPSFILGQRRVRLYLCGYLASSKIWRRRRDLTPGCLYGGRRLASLYLLYFHRREIDLKNRQSLCGSKSCQKKPPKSANLVAIVANLRPGAPDGLLSEVLSPCSA